MVGVIRKYENTGPVFATKKERLSGLGHKIKAFRAKQQKDTVVSSSSPKSGVAA